MPHLRGMPNYQGKTRIFDTGSSPVIRRSLGFQGNERIPLEKSGGIFCIVNKNKPPAMQVCSQAALASSIKTSMIQ